MSLPTTWTKLDNDTTADDEATHALVPQRMALNAAACHLGRATSMSRVFRRMDSSGGGTDTDLVPQVSTHPDLWWEIPVMIWAPTGTTSMRLVMDYESDMGDGSGTAGVTDTARVRLHVQGLGESSATGTTVQKTSAITQVAETLSGFKIHSGQWLRGSIQIQSIRSGTVVTNGTALEILTTSSRPAVMEINRTGGAITLSTGRAHLAAVVDAGTRIDGSTTTQPDTYYVGYVSSIIDRTESEYALEYWPEMEAQGEGTPRFDRSKTSYITFDLYPLGYLQIYGWSIECKQPNNIQAPSADLYEPGAPVTALGLRTLYGMQRRLWRERVQIVTAGPRSGFVDEPRLGAPFSGRTASTLAGCITARRPGKVGYEVKILAYSTSIATTGADVGQVQVQVALAPASGTTTTVAYQSYPVTYARSSYRIGDGGMIGAFNAGNAADKWGAADLLGEGETGVLTEITIPIEYNDDVANWVLADLAILLDEGQANVMAVSVREVF